MPWKIVGRGGRDARLAHRAEIFGEVIIYTAHHRDNRVKTANTAVSVICKVPCEAY
jgi:hypothetical protein